MTDVAEAPAPGRGAAGAATSEEQARELATQWADEQAARLTERVRTYVARKNGQSNGGLAPRIGGPTTYEPAGVPYVAFDMTATSPIQLIGWAVPPGVQPGGLPWRMTLHQANLITGSNLPAQVASGAFPGPAPVFTPVFFLLPTTPGTGPGRGPVADRGQRHRYLIYNS